MSERFEHLSDEALMKRFGQKLDESAINELIDRILQHRSVTVNVPDSESSKVGVHLETQQGALVNYRQDYVVAH